MTANIPSGLNFGEGMPFYWQQETSGKMKEIIQKFLKQQPMNDWEYEIFRWYVWQWTRAMPVKPDDFNKILLMNLQELSSYLTGELLELGIDPI